MPPPVLRDHYSVEEFRSLIDREGDRIELKTGAGAKPLQEALVAFSNTEGGLIFIGVDNDRRVVGRSLDQSTDDQIPRAAAVDAHNVGRYRIRQITVDQAPVVVVEVSRREDGFAQTSDGRILVRRGARNQPLIGDDVWRLASSRTLRRFERSLAGVRRGQVDGRLLQRVCAVYGWDPAVADLDDRLRERGLLRDGDELTIAGALVLTDPAQTLNASKLVVEIRWYEGAGPDPRRRMTIGGSLPEQVSMAAQLVIDELGSDLVVTGIHRRDLPRLPSVVVREAIANAVAHRSYERDQSAIIIEIRPHQVVVTSPGPLPEGVTVATMRHAQAARNPSVIAVLRQFRLTEDAGRGVDVMQDVMRDEMLDPPIFDEPGEFVRVTLPIKGPITPQERAWLKDLEEWGTLAPVGRLLLVHAARCEPVLRLELLPGGGLGECSQLTMPRRLTNAEARKITGLDREEARTALKRLRDQGFLTQHGQRGGAYYLLNPTLIQGAAHGMTDEEIEQLVLDAAKEQPIRNENVRRLTGLDSAAVGSMLRRLTERGLLERRGEKRGTEYVHTGL
ncbi:MAG: ATP-binding protein [Pseudonocardiaceae bacterium]